MNALLAKIEAFVKDEDGLTIVEYAVAGALIAAALVLAFATLGEQVGFTVNRLICAVQGEGYAGAPFGADMCTDLDTPTFPT